jgi:hypothetical protein
VITCWQVTYFSSFSLLHIPAGMQTHHPVTRWVHRREMWHSLVLSKNYHSRFQSRTIDNMCSCGMRWYMFSVLLTAVQHWVVLASAMHWFVLSQLPLTSFWWHPCAITYSYGVYFLQNFSMRECICSSRLPSVCYSLPRTRQPTRSHGWRWTLKADMSLFT